MAGANRRGPVGSVCQSGSPHATHLRRFCANRARGIGAGRGWRNCAAPQRGQWATPGDRGVVR